MCISNPPVSAAADTGAGADPSENVEDDAGGAAAVVADVLLGSSGSVLLRCLMPPLQSLHSQYLCCGLHKPAGCRAVADW